MKTNTCLPIKALMQLRPSIWSPIPHVLLIIATAWCADGQRSPPSASDKQFVIATLIAVFFSAAFFTILFIVLYLAAFFVVHLVSGGDAGGSSDPETNRSSKLGLDPATIASFPMIPYAAARKLRIGLGGGALECAVCLCEFDDDEILKILPGCRHVYHPECIDGWLSRHVTCPVCRANLAGGEVAIVVGNDSEMVDRVRIPRSRSAGNLAAGTAADFSDDSPRSARFSRAISLKIEIG